MSPEPPPTPFKDECLAARIPAATLSEKQQKKICRKAEKAEMLARRQRHQHQQQQLTHGSDDLFEANYGDIPLEEIQSKAISGRSWTQVCDLDAVAVGRSVLVRAAIQAIREVSNKMVFFVLRQSMSTVQCVLVSSADSGTSTQMVRFTASLSVESIVQVEGVVCLPKDPVKACTQKVPPFPRWQFIRGHLLSSGTALILHQKKGIRVDWCFLVPLQVEIQVRKIYCVNRAILALLINFEDLTRSENEIEKGEHVYCFKLYVNCPHSV
jgi:aspartyl-tRNA synthetase